MAIEMLTERIGIINSVTTIGVVFTDNGAVVIDTGWNRAAGEEIYNELCEAGKKLIAIINTHAHLDHAGGNGYLIEMTGCKTYFTRYESMLVRGEPQVFANIYDGTLHPVVEIRKMFNIFSDFEPNVIEPDSSIEIDGVTFDVVDLPGHTEAHVGIAVDNVLFCGDTLMHEDDMRMAKIMVIGNPGKQRKSVLKLRESNYALYVPGHGRPFTDPKATCDLVTGMIDKIEGYINELTQEPIQRDSILSEIMTRLSINARGMVTYNTSKLTINAIINTMIDEDRLDYTFINNILA